MEEPINTSAPGTCAAVVTFFGNRMCASQIVTQNAAPWVFQKIFRNSWGRGYLQLQTTMRCDRDGGGVKLGCPRSATAAVFLRGDRGKGREIWTWIERVRRSAISDHKSKDWRKRERRGQREKKVSECVVKHARWKLKTRVSTIEWTWLSSPAQRGTAKGPIIWLFLSVLDSS